MAKGKKHTPEQILSLLRQIELAVANGKTTPVACREGGITEQTYYRWRKEYSTSYFGQELAQWHDLSFGIEFEALGARIKNDLSRRFDICAPNVEAFAGRGTAKRTLDLKRPSFLGAKFNHQIDFGASRSAVERGPSCRWQYIQDVLNEKSFPTGADNRMA